MTFVEKKNNEIQIIQKIIVLLYSKNVNLASSFCSFPISANSVTKYHYSVFLLLSMKDHPNENYPFIY